ncbi:MAG: adenylate/guanylate cyclase domain-containing protein [Acidimicrobiales bacterium]
MPERPTTQYARTEDGSQIAYQVIGQGPFDLVYLTGHLSHVDVRWEHPPSARFLDRLASFSRLIIFDRRGLGASDRLPTDTVPTWEEWAEDLRVVLDAVGSKTAVLFAVADGGAMAITFAATHPERVTALGLFHGLVNALPADSDDERNEELSNLAVQAQEELWGTADWVRIITPSLADDPVQTAWMTKYMRATATPRAIAIQQAATWRTRVDFVLPSIQVPTLVLQRTDFPHRAITSARQLTEHIPDGRFVEVPGSDVMPQTEDADLILDLLQEFVTGARPSSAPDRFLTTVLFTDIVDSTQQATAMGDRAWTGLLDLHDEMVREELARFRGKEVQTTGDGFLVTFDGPGRGIQCANAIRSRAKDMGVEVRVGLHTGEVEARGEDIGGIAVHIGARVAAAAAPGEILVSRTVTDLVAGSGIEFEDRGNHELKGVPNSWRLFAFVG